MKKVFIFTLAVIAALAIAAPSAQTLSSERLKRVDQFFQEQVDQERIVALVLQDGKPVYERAFGWADKEANRKMTPDAIFRIASQSKALTSAVVLSLMEEGKLGLNDAAGGYIPTFAKTMVSVANGTETALSPLTTVAGLTYNTTNGVRIRVQATGTNPTMLRTRVWPGGTAEPSTWNATATDSTAALQVAGGLGLTSYLSSSATNAPVSARFDDLSAAPVPDPADVRRRCGPRRSQASAC